MVSMKVMSKGGDKLGSFVVRYGFAVYAKDMTDADEKVKKRLREKLGEECFKKLEHEADEHGTSVW